MTKDSSSKNQVPEPSVSQPQAPSTSQLHAKEKADKEAKIRSWTENKVAISNGWIDNDRAQIGRQIVQGGIYFCEFGENIGHEQSERRPVLVVSRDLVNHSSGNVLIVPLTKNLKTKIDRKTGKTIPRFSSHYFLFMSKYGFLTYDSAVKAEETTSISKIRLDNLLGALDSADFDKIKNRLRWVLDF